jgi:hypothetical protein
MSNLHPFVDQQVDVEISGDYRICTGKLIDLGLDVMVLLYKQRYYYIPLVHVQNLKVSLESNDEDSNVLEAPLDYQTESLSFRKILQHAKGRFVEIYVSGNKAIHGYLTSIMNDYFVFHSPVYKAMFISMNHLKWLIPYAPDRTPYSLGNPSFLVNTVPITLSRTFEEQCKKLEGGFVVFDLGDHPNKIGFLQKADHQIMQVVTADGEKVCWNLQHLKSVYRP